MTDLLETEVMTELDYIQSSLTDVTSEYYVYSEQMCDCSGSCSGGCQGSCSGNCPGGCSGDCSGGCSWVKGGLGHGE